MKAIRDKTTGKLTFKINKSDDSSETQFGKELQKRKLDKKNEEFSKDRKTETGLNRNMLPERKSGKQVGNKMVFDK